jgi:hypothetical protein
MGTDASLKGIALAYAALAAYTMALLPGVGMVDLGDAEERAAALAFFPFCVPAGVAVLCWLLARPFGRGVRPHPRGPGVCHLCGRRAPIADIRVLKVTGMLVLLVLHQEALRACRGCGLRACFGAIGHTLVLGWWGIFSFFITPGFILHDLAMSMRLLACTSGVAGKENG